MPPTHPIPSHLVGLFERCGNVSHFELAACAGDLYRLLNRPLHKLLVCDSPRDLSEKAAPLLASGAEVLLHDELWSKVVKDVAPKLLSTASKKLGASFDSARNEHWYPISLSWNALICEPSLKQAVKDASALGNKLQVAHHPSALDADWLTFHEQQLGAFTNNTLPWALYNLVTQGLWFGTFARNEALICPFPDTIQLDDAGRLHCEDGPALYWSGDNYGQFFWHGLAVPGKLIAAPESVTREDIMMENNAEVRRCFHEILGSDRFGQLLGLEVLHEKTDRFGQLQQLLRTRERDRLCGDHIYFARVTCPTSHRQYYLCVPPGMRTVDEAVAWTFGKTASTYRPEVET